jgi:16S rRNA (adenine1518-N6/adenine1519-N6)-dimethyltransferase
VTPRDDPVVASDHEARYRRFVQDAFGLRRKQLRRVVRTIVRADADRAEMIVVAAGLDPEARPESLSPDDFARLLAAVASVSGRDS